jgi:hypothetical protein
MNSQKGKKNCQLPNNSKTIFDYITDSTMFINKEECNDYTLPLGYINTGVLSKNIDLETELKGLNRQITKCNNCKYIPDDNTLSQKSVFQQSTLSSKPECKKN